MLAVMEFANMCWKFGYRGSFVTRMTRLAVIGCVIELCTSHDSRADIPAVAFV